MEIVPRAVGDGTALAGKAHKGDGMLQLGDTTASEEIQFQSISLDEYVAKGALSPTVMKIDVDGYELCVLNGARECLAKYRPRLWVEMHPGFLAAQGKSQDDVLNLLRQTGYAICFFEDYDLPHAKISYHIWCVFR